jgi:nucleoside-diphosphate-sugar epimerase
MGTWQGGKEKVPAALCRKVAMAGDDPIEIWGDGNQTRTFLFIDECVEGVLRLMKSSFTGPVNIGSEEMVTINQLAQMIISLSGKKLTCTHIPGPQGVRGRRSDNHLVRGKLNWSPQQPLLEGLEVTYQWIDAQVARSVNRSVTVSVDTGIPKEVVCIHK